MTGESWVLQRSVPVLDLRAGDRIWVGDDGRLVVAVADEGAVVALTVQLPLLGDVVARLPRDTRFELCRDREVSR